MTDKIKQWKLERLEKRRDEIKSLLSVKDELSKSFYGGMVGFKKGSCRKKWERGIDKELQLIRELKEVELNIDKIINPIKRSVTPFVSALEFNVGEKVYHQGAGLIVEVIRINKKSVTIKYSDSYKEPVEPRILKHIK